MRRDQRRGERHHHGEPDEQDAGGRTPVGEELHQHAARRGRQRLGGNVAQLTLTRGSTSV